MRGPHPVTMVFGLAIALVCGLFGARFDLGWVIWSALGGAAVLVVWAGLAHRETSRRRREETADD